MSVHVCPDCGYTYDEALGDRHEGYAPGTRFEQLPDDFVCPDCAVRGKADFLCNGQREAS
jgi:alkane 1-monooxygenase